MQLASLIDLLALGAGLNFAFGAFSQYTDQLLSAEKGELQKSFSRLSSKSGTPDQAEYRKKLDAYEEMREVFFKIQDDYERRSLAFAYSCAISGAVLAAMLVVCSFLPTRPIPDILYIIIVLLNAPWLLFLFKNLLDYTKLKLEVQRPRIDWEDGIDSLT